MLPPFCCLNPSTPGSCGLQLTSPSGLSSPYLGNTHACITAKARTKRSPYTWNLSLVITGSATTQQHRSHILDHLMAQETDPVPAPDQQKERDHPERTNTAVPWLAEFRVNLKGNCNSWGWWICAQVPGRHLWFKVDAAGGLIPLVSSQCHLVDLLWY